MLGMYYATTEGVLAAAGSAMIPPALRTTGLAVLATIIAAARLASSIAFGFAWTWFGVQTAVVCFGVCLAVALAMALFVLRPGIAIEEVS
jgi:hypothetical protein